LWLNDIKEVKNMCADRDKKIKQRLSDPNTDEGMRQRADHCTNEELCTFCATPVGGEKGRCMKRQDNGAPKVKKCGPGSIYKVERLHTDKPGFNGYMQVVEGGDDIVAENQAPFGQPPDEPSSGAAGRGKAPTRSRYGAAGKAAASPPTAGHRQAKASEATRFAAAKRQAKRTLTPLQRRQKVVDDEYRKASTDSCLYGNPLTWPPNSSSTEWIAMLNCVEDKLCETTGCIKRDAQSQTDDAINVLAEVLSGEPPELDGAGRWRADTIIDGYTRSRIMKILNSIRNDHCKGAGEEKPAACS